ncbi:MAG: PHP domain-containing protein [Thaumarchaeota archaeon]|nr:PHP domain-containing protein [Nitrososphaerota archaeon]MDE0267226.1 PHP domain-containing protein [Nitrososphaerota archaeon]MDE0525873.1 PHP domain-containing protein [Nitrososphaerota archaeon]
MSLKAELHCHNSFSNFHLGSDEPPYDCDVSIRDQLERARALGLDAVFVTNHNTLDGYEQMLQYRNDHEKFAGIRIHPAEEVTTDRGAHVLAYGIHEAIPPGIPLEEIVESVREQGGVSSAPHPFSLLDALRDDAARCDMVEVFNSNNVDVLSNARAAQFAAEKNMVSVAGSDSHVLSTLGRCVNIIDSENALDDILHALRRGRTQICQAGYAMRDETLDHLRYKLNNSREYVTEYMSEHYPHAKWFLRLLLRMYDLDQDNPLWGLIYRLCVCAMRRISRKVNFEGLDPQFMRQRNLGTMFYKAL